MKSEVGETVGRPRTSDPSLVPILPASLLLVILASVLVTANGNGRAGYDIHADWVTVQSAFNGFTYGSPIRDLAEPLGISLPNLEGVPNAVHARLPGAVLMFAPLAVLPVAVVFPISLLLNVAALSALMVFVQRRYQLSSTVTAAGGVLIASTLFTRTALGFGTISAFLAVTATAAWFTSRRSDVSQGGILGLMAVLKLYPGILVLSWSLAGRWRPVVWAVLGASVVNIAGMMIFSIGPAQVVELFREASHQFVGFDGNISLAGALIGEGVAEVVAIGIGVFAVAGWTMTLRRARADVDAAFAVATTAVLLGLPVVWDHYWLLSIPVLGWLWAVVATTWARFGGLVWSAGWVLIGVGDRPDAWTFQRVGLLLGLVMAVSVTHGIVVASKRSTPDAEWATQHTVVGRVG